MDITTPYTKKWGGLLKSKKAKILLGCLAVVACYIFYATVTFEKRDAERVAKEFIEDRLYAPSTIEYIGDPAVTKIKKHTYRVEGEFDAQNKFGATMRGSYDLEITLDKKENEWTLLYINILDRQ